MRKTVILILFLMVSVMVGQDLKEYMDFSGVANTGETITLSHEIKGNTVVLIFVSTRCPVSNAYNERMEQLYEDFHSKGIRFIGINSNKAESVEEIKQHARDNNLTFPIIKDEKNNIADLYHASVTPEVVVISSDGKIVYHGRIDDSRRIDKVTVQDLRLVLNAIVLNKQIPIYETKAFGCSIKRQ